MICGVTETSLLGLNAAVHFASNYARMKTIITTYPGYQDLPVGIKRMLVVSEDFFFREMPSAAARAKIARRTQREAADRRIKQAREGRFWVFGPGWRN